VSLCCSSAGSTYSRFKRCCGSAVVEGFGLVPTIVSFAFDVGILLRGLGTKGIDDLGWKGGYRSNHQEAKHGKQLVEVWNVVSHTDLGQRPRSYQDDRLRVETTRDCGLG
jgi:hypothetical protein